MNLTEENSAVTSTTRAGPTSASVPDPPPSTEVERLYRTEYEAMVRLARLLTGSLHVGEELVQDAFVEVSRRLDRIDNPGGYLRKTVVHRCYGHNRRRSLEGRTVSQIDSRSDQPALPPELDETWRLLSRLRHKQRIALVLRYYEDLSIRQVAELMGEREGTVKSLVHRGLRQLRKEMKL